MLLAKLRETWICLKAGRVTLPYPFAPHEPAAGFRGKVTVDAEELAMLRKKAELLDKVGPDATVRIETLEKENKVIQDEKERTGYLKEIIDQTGTDGLGRGKLSRV